jgi:arylformamidase
MKIIDITAPLTDSLPVWPGDPSPEIQISRIESDEGIIHITSLKFGAHTGTHVDAPLHFLPEGGGVADLDLRSLIGPALVVDVGDVSIIDHEVLDRVVGDRVADRLLFRSARNRGELAHTKFFEEYTALSPDGARWVVSRGIRLVGIDYLSVGPFKGGNGDTHRTLLGRHVVIVEGLELGNVEPGEYVLVCLPLKLPYDGAPCRAVLLPKGTIV